MKNSGALATTKLSRREFLKLSGVGLAGATLLGTVGCGGGGSAGEGLVFTSYGGSFQRAQANAWLKPYSKETELIAYCVSAENNHRLSEYIEYTPVNKESISKADPQVAPQLPTAHRKVGVRYDAEWWDDNREAVMERFDKWVRG